MRDDEGEANASFSQLLGRQREREQSFDGKREGGSKGLADGALERERTVR